MTVLELIAELERLSPDMVVYLVGNEDYEECNVVSYLEDRPGAVLLTSEEVEEE